MHETTLCKKQALKELDVHQNGAKKMNLCRTLIPQKRWQNTLPAHNLRLNTTDEEDFIRRGLIWTTGVYERTGVQLKVYVSQRNPTRLDQ